MGITDLPKVRHLPLADNIIVLDKDGKLIEQGTFKTLRSREGFVNRLMLHPELLESEAKSEFKEEKTSPKGPAAVPKDLRGPSPNDVADLTRQTGDVSVYKYYLKSIGWKIGLANVASSFIYTLGTKFTREYFQCCMFPS